MQTFEMDNQRNDGKRAWWRPRAHMVLGGANAVVSIIILVMTVLLLNGQEAEDQKMTSGTNAQPEFFFLTAEDQKLRANHSYRWINLTEEVSPDDCLDLQSNICLTDLIYHGHCKSKPRFVRVENITALDRKHYTLVPPQFFPTETCTSTSLRLDRQCQCQLINNMFRGYTGQKWVWFLLPACCKCVN